MATTRTTEAARVLLYLGLPSDYSPSPSNEPVSFLSLHIHQLPPELLSVFSALTTARERSTVPAIRNRRFRYTQSKPSELKTSNAKRSWPALWEGPPEPPTSVGKDSAREEHDWVERNFLGGSSTNSSGEKRHHVGKLGSLLGGYEEERELERIRGLRRDMAAKAAEEFVPEEDESSEEEEEAEVPSRMEGRSNSGGIPPQNDSIEEMQGLFDRRVREQFIYGLLQVFLPAVSLWFHADNICQLSSHFADIYPVPLQSDLYDVVDWDEQWDGDGEDAQDRWFADDD